MAEKFMLFDDAERQLLIERYSDLKFEDDTNGFKCVRCNRIPITHYFTNCGHLLCLNCKRIIDNGGFKCQQCNRLITNASEQRIEFEFQLLSLRSKCPNTKYGCQLTTNLAQIPEHVKNCEFTQEAALPALLKNKDTNQMMLENLKLLREEMKAMRAEVKQLHLKNNEDQFPDATNLQNFVRNEPRTGSVKDEIDLEKSQQVEIERKNEGSSMSNFVSKEILEEMLRAQQQQLSNEMQANFNSQMETQKRIYNEELQKIAMKVSNLEAKAVLNDLNRVQNAQVKMNTEFENPMLKQETISIDDINFDDDYIYAPIKEVTLLLVGPISVGKSTFINAFVNYLKFKDLDQAQRSGPQCLIPCAFTIYENQYQTHNVKFGKEDANENTEAQGQSATQKCKVYPVVLPGLTLNLIDSPGFGDTRGEEQDMRNVSHIIDFVAPYDKLVIAVLLKPNETRLTAVLENCIRKLIIHFYSDACRDIVFIFTNSRSFSYQPGDTIIPLKEILQKLQQPPLATPIEIKFSKENVFCVDSEAFRYLVAQKNGVRFSNNDYDDFKESWQTSAEECKRMIKYFKGETSAASEVGQSQPQSIVSKLYSILTSSNTKTGVRKNK